MPTPNTPTIWHVPYQRNPSFTGREDVLNQLHQTLHAETTVALSHPQGISGLGGIGKTQTALEYAYRYRAEYAAIFWVRADSRPALTSSLVELAHVLELPERHEQDQEILVQAVLRWFRLHPDWLLIYDNIDNLSIAEPFLPKAGTGHLLFTTRAHAFGELAQRVEIQQMEPEIGALLLLRRASLLAIQATLNLANPDDQSIARAISQELDGLPLALDQAGAYIKEVPCPLPDYLGRYQTRRSDLLRERGSFDQGYPASVATTWSLSFEKIRQTIPASAELLNFCAFLAPDAIPEKMLMRGAPHLPPILQEALAHPVQFDLVTAALLGYSLLHRNMNETLDIHRLVQIVVRDNIPAKKQSRWSQVQMVFHKQTSVTIQTQKDWKQRAVQVVNVATPDMQDIDQWNDCEQWVPHAQVCATWIEQEHMTFPEAAHLLNEAGYYLDIRARYAEGEPLFVRALSISEQELGAMHPDTASSLNALALLYDHQGKYEQAEPLYVRALSIREQQLGPLHPNTAHTLNNLAGLYRAQGMYEQAEPLYQRALSICEQQLGPLHPNTAIGLNELAVLYYSQRKYERAEPLFVQALSISEQQLGPQHSETATRLNNLAELYRAQGKYAQAEPLYERALAIREQQLGTQHPDTAQSLNNLASLYQDQGKYTETKPLYLRALAIVENTLGRNHPSTQAVRANYVFLLRTMGRDAEVKQWEVEM